MTSRMVNSYQEALKLDYLVIFILSETSRLFTSNNLQILYHIYYWIYFMINYKISCHDFYKVNCNLTYFMISSGH